MNYNKIGTWLNGYLDAIQTGETVTKAQIELLIHRLKEFILEIEEEEKNSISTILPPEDDDLPF